MKGWLYALLIGELFFFALILVLPHVIPQRIEPLHAGLSGIALLTLSKRGSH
jgi:hypothetical protein